MIISGSSGSSSCVGACRGSSSSSTSHTWSRPWVHGTSRTTRRCMMTLVTVGQLTSALSAVSFIGITWPHAEPPQRAGETAHLLIELAVRQSPHVARLTLPDERDLVVELVIAVAVEAALDDVHAPADPPLRPGLAVGEVDQTVVVAIEGDVDVLDGGVPEPFDVLVRTFQKLGEGLDAVLIHEELQAALRDHFRAWFPDHVPDHD